MHKNRDLMLREHSVTDIIINIVIREVINLKVGDNPIAKKLAELLGHPESSHPLRHSTKGFNVELERIHNQIKSKYPDQTKNQITVGTLKSYIAGRRSPQFDSIKKISEAYEVIHGVKIDPYDFFVDSDRWINIGTMTDKKRHIINLLSEVDDENFLEGLEKLCQASLRGKERGHES